MDLPAVVWKDIVGYLSVQDVKNLRLVCQSHSTDEILTRQLLNSAHKSVNSTEQLDSYFGIFPKSVRLIGTEVHLQQFLDMPVFLDLEIKHLKVQCLFNENSLKSLLTTSMGKRLTSLHLDCGNIRDNSDSEDSSTESDVVGTSESCLQTLTITNVSTSIIQLIPEVVHLFSHFHIRTLDVGMETLELVLPFLSSNWKHLMSLRVTDWDHRFLETHTTFPTLSNLEKLVLVSAHHYGGLYYNYDPNSKPSLGILKSFPKIKYVSLQITSFPNVFPPREKFISSLESLNVVQFSLPPSVVPQMAKYFPHLKQLDFFDMSNAAFSSVCGHLCNLEILRLGTSTSDSGITGISAQCIKKAYLCAGKGESVDSLRKQAYIGNLQKLRKITIVSTKVSDASVTFGLVDCKKLETIKFERPVLTDAALHSLEEAELPHLRIVDIIVHREVTIQGVESFKNKYPGCVLHLGYWNRGFDLI